MQKSRRHDEPGIEHRFTNAASLFLDFGAADRDCLGVRERLLDRLGNRNYVGTGGGLTVAAWPFGRKLTPRVLISQEAASAY